MKRCTIAELRAMADLSDPRQVHMLAAIDAIAALVGDDHGKILAALQGAYVTVAIATGSDDEVLRSAVANLDASRRDLAGVHLVALDTAGCTHERTTRGADVPRLYGSWRTEVCRDCGAFRTHGHDAARSQLSAWRPASEYAEATEQQELE